MMPHVRRIGEDKIETLRGRLLFCEISLHDVKAALAPKVLGRFRKQRIKLDAGCCFYALCRDNLGKRRVKRSSANRRVEEAEPPLP